jgi:hypothetical protein
MHIIYRVDGKDFETKDEAVEYVTTAYFPDIEDLVVEEEPDRDGYHLEVSNQNSDAETVTIFIVESDTALNTLQAR